MNAGPMGAGHLRPDSVDPARRELGPDVTRSLALFGVILMNYHGYLILRGAPRRDGALSTLLDPWEGVLSTRFAATFVLVAGIGVTLMTRSALGDPERIRALRWRLASRGVVLYAFGLGLDLVWRGSILPFYGAMFAIAAVLFTLRTRWLVTLGVVVAIASWAVAWWVLEQRLDGADVRWLTNPGPGSVRGLLFDVAINGTHPLLPWLTFFIAGMVVGRLLDRRHNTTVTAAVGLAALLLATGAHAVAGRGPWTVGGAPSTRAAVLFSTEPFDRGLLYTISALGSALLAFALVSALTHRVGRATPIDVLARAGQASLSVYVLHVLVFNLLVDVVGWVEPTGASTALVFAVVVWAGGTIAAAWWQRRWQRGPLEQVYRSITR